MRARPPAAGAVVILLPLTNRIVSFDPVTAKVREIVDLDRTQFGGLFDSTIVGDRLIVTGGPPGGLAGIDLRTGDVVTRGRFGEVGVSAEAAAVGPGGTLYVIGSTGEPEFAGVLLEVDPITLEVRAETPLPTKQVLNATVVMPDGTILSLASGEGRGRVGLSIVAPGSDPVVRPVSGGPQRVALGPSGLPLVTLYGKDSVVEVDLGGSITRAVRGLGEAPIGIAVGSDGIGVVAAEGAAEVEGSVHFIDFNEMRLLESLPR